MSTKYTKMPEGGAQAVMTMTVSKELEARADKLWETHANWFKKTHVNKGENACLFYHVCKSAEMDDFTKGKGGTPTGNTTFTIVEFYASEAGLDNHFAKFHASHECADFGEMFGALLKDGAYA